jgi:hypothetical protein
VSKAERRKRWEATLAAGGVYDRGDKVEKRIRVEAAHHIPVGEGKWATPSESVFGKAIYHISHGPVTLVFSQLGFTYEGSSRSFECRYDEIAEIRGPTLRDYALVRGDGEELLTSYITLREVQHRYEMRMQPRLGWVVVMLQRVLHELA